MNTPSIMPRIILGLVLAGILAAIWYFTFSHSFLHLPLAGTTDKVEVTNSQTGRLVASRTVSAWLNLPTGDYLVTAYQAGQVTSLQAAHIGPFSITVLNLEPSSVKQKALPFLSQAADFVTPLGQGYVYLDKTTRALNYADATGTTNISARFNLTTDPQASLAVSEQHIFNSLVGIEPTASGGVVITTTRGVFTAGSPNNISQLPVYPKATLNYTASAYDRQTNSLFVLSSHSKTVYRYDLSKPAVTPTAFYEGKLEFNRVAAGGGKIVAYFDSVPSSEPAVLTQYAVKHQLSPLVIDATNGQLLKELSDYQPVTYLSVSTDGGYLAIKQKLARSITVYDLTSNKTTIIPSHDTGGAGWRGDTFYLARNKAIWLYNAKDKDAGLTKVATINDPVTRLLVTTTDTILTTNQPATAILKGLDTTKPPITIPPAPANPNGAQYIYYAPPPETEH